ncbi:UDP-N-acetylbacillosamine N-acetyltransferase [Sporomusa carbonis]|uniref:acetyltransferase n=1 Tax=Sporomusa carbonis TaxID=3076075 RepID=UPI003A66D1E6
MNKTQKLVIIGAGETAEMAYEYFSYDSDYEVCAFSVEKEFMSETSLGGIPIIPFEDLELYYRPDQFETFVALGYGKLNRSRSRLYTACKEKGYTLAKYISSKAFVWRNVTIGDNCFILENNVLQYQVRIGNNVVLWSGNHIGHRSVIGNNCFLSSHVIISGYCSVGDNCFFGVNSCVGDNVKIAEDCVVGAGAVILNDTELGKIYQGNPAIPARVNSYRVFNVRS